MPHAAQRHVNHLSAGIVLLSNIVSNLSATNAEVTLQWTWNTARFRDTAVGLDHIRVTPLEKFIAGHEQEAECHYRMAAFNRKTGDSKKNPSPTNGLGQRSRGRVVVVEGSVLCLIG